MRFQSDPVYPHVCGYVQVAAQIRATCLELRHPLAQLWAESLGAWLDNEVHERTEVRLIDWDRDPPELLGFVAAAERVLPDRVRISTR
jgi:hypothetical protein